MSNIFDNFSKPACASTLGWEFIEASSEIGLIRISFDGKLSFSNPVGFIQGRCLTADQETQIRQRLIDKTPDQLKLNYKLWTRRVVLGLIEQEIGIRLAIRTVGKYLSLSRFTPQKPLRKAYLTLDNLHVKVFKAWLETHAVHSHMTMLQNKPARVRKYFQHRFLRYATSLFSCQINNGAGCI